MIRSMIDSLIAAGWRARVVPGLALALAVSLAGCDSLIDVENPNNVPNEDFESPVSAASVVSGAWTEVSDAWGESLTPYATATDELTWIGSRDSWKQLELGTLSDRTNEFSDVAFPNVAEARWLADEAIRLMEGHAANVPTFDDLLLARAYLMGAVAYTMIADRWDDFVVSSDRDEAGPAVGEANMGTLYDVATGYLSDALPIAQAATDQEDLVATILALRASVAHRKAIWSLVQPSRTGAPPLYVGAPAAALADANAALALIGDDNWTFSFSYDPSFLSNDPGGLSQLDNDIGDWVNERQEHRIDVDYGIPSSNNKTITGTALMDPINNVPSPALSQIIAEFGTVDFGPLRVVSEQELYLILAETALAAGDLQTAQDRINDLRGLFSTLTAYDRNALGAPTVGAMIQHHRKASLFLQGRRLSDMYRFGINDFRWEPTSEARNSPGVFLPITLIECNANPEAGCS